MLVLSDCLSKFVFDEDFVRLTLLVFAGDCLMEDIV